jgi:tripartite-type tricarboxylate transporter receptor subunit TctC
VEDFLAVAVPPSLPVDSVADLVSLAQKKPGEMNYHAVPGAPYLAYLAFQKSARINTTFVPYNSPANVISDLTEGRLHIAVMPLASMLGIAQGGKIKLLAITNDRRSPTAAHVPTMAEAGYPGFFAGGLLGMFAPRDMPSEVREKIALDMCAVLGRPEIQARLANFGLAARGTTPNEFAAILEGQRTKWAAIAQANNIKPQR